MEDSEVVIKYNGLLSFDTIGNLLNTLKDETEARGISMVTYKKVLSVMIEALENIFKYNDRFTSEASLFPTYNPDIVLEKKDTYFYFRCSNPVQNKDLEHLKSRIDKVNALDRDALKELYRNTLQDGQFTQKGGAGLGFIEMAKVTGEKISYDVKPINDNFSFYTCTVPIPIKM